MGVELVLLPSWMPSLHTSRSGSWSPWVESSGRLLLARPLEQQLHGLGNLYMRANLSHLGIVCFSVRALLLSPDVCTPRSLDFLSKQSIRLVAVLQRSMYHHLPLLSAAAAAVVVVERRVGPASNRTRTKKTRTRSRSRTRPTRRRRRSNPRLSIWY